MMGSSLKSKNTSTAEFADLLTLVQNKKEYQTRLDEIIAAISRLEELQAGYKTLKEIELVKIKTYKYQLKADLDNKKAKEILKNAESHSFELIRKATEKNSETLRKTEAALDHAYIRDSAAKINSDKLKEDIAENKKRMAVLLAEVELREKNSIIKENQAAAVKEKWLNIEIEMKRLMQ